MSVQPAYSLSVKDRDLLVAILGLLGSAQLGERAAAALKASELLQRSHLTWAELLTCVASDPSARAHHHTLTAVQYPSFDIMA